MTAETPRPGKPTGFELWGERHDVSSYTDILVGVAAAIRQQDAGRFDREVGWLRGRVRPFASKNPDDLLRPRRVGGSDWYVEINLSAAATVKRVRVFLEHFGYDPDELVVLYGPGASAASVQAQPPQSTVDARAGSPVPVETAKPGKTTEPAKPAKPPARPVDGAQPKGQAPKEGKKGKRAPKPIGFELWGERHDVSSYTDILVGVAAAIRQQDAGRFDREVGGLRGRVRPFASKNPDDLLRPRRVGGSDWYVEINLDAAATVKRARRFLEHFGFDPDELVVLYGPGASAASVQAQPRQRAARRAGSSAPAQTRQPSGKPIGFELWGERHDVSSYTDILVGVAAAIRQQDAGRFDREVGGLRGRVRPFASKNPDDLLRARQVGGSDWYVEINLSAAATIKRARRFLEHFGYDPDELEVFYGPGTGSTSSESGSS